jgi:hypothetical protein
MRRAFVFMLVLTPSAQEVPSLKAPAVVAERHPVEAHQQAEREQLRREAPRRQEQACPARSTHRLRLRPGWQIPQPTRSETT